MTVKDKEVLVSESGINTREDVKKLAKAGVRAVLIGESLAVPYKCGTTSCPSTPSMVGIAPVSRLSHHRFDTRHAPSSSSRKARSTVPSPLLLCTVCIA